MRILLINPGFEYQTPWLQIAEPLGLLYLSSYIRQYARHEVAVLDCVANSLVEKRAPHRYWYGLSGDRMLDRVAEYQPDIVGISCLFSRKKKGLFECAAQIKARFPEIAVVAGGTYPTLFPEETIRSGFIDYCILGEGERSVVEFLDLLSAGDLRQLDSMQGVAFRREGEVVVNPRREYISDLDTIPFPARDLIDYESYLTRRTVMYGLGLRRAASILTSRSCPNRCSFCSMFRIHGDRWRGRSPRNVVDEIVELQARYGVQHLFVMDDNFSFQKDRAMAICEGILAAKIKIRWNTPNGLSIKTLDAELLRMMKRAGCANICVAIESGDEELRNKVIGKRLSNSKIVEALAAARQTGMPVTAFYIIGMPGETEEKFENTLRQIRELPLNGAAASFANPLPGTQLHAQCVANQYTVLDNDECSANALYRPYIITPDFSEADLVRREKRFYRTFIRAKWLTILWDTIRFRNGLLYPPFLMRMIKERLFRSS